MSRRCVFGLATLGLAAVLAAGVPASADDLATVAAKVPAAMLKTKSFVVTTAVGGSTVTMTFVAPDRYHSVLVYSGGVRDVVLVGATAYVSDGSGPYRKIDAPPEIVSASAQLRNVPVDAILPDKISGSKTYGMFTTTSAGPQKDQHLSCRFDKKTYRIVDCSNEAMVLTFSRYDDPANAVTVPSNVVTAPPGAH